MDNSSLTSENESLSEAETLRQQLNTYKKINADLSKKVQSLNAELSVHKQAITQLRAENQEQHENNVKYRQYCRTINTQCMTFINSYTNLVQNFVDDDPIIEINPRTVNSESPEDVTIIPQIQRPKRPEIVRPQLHNGLNSDENVDNNVLNTILEESNVGPFTSTPVVPNRLVNSALLLPAITPVHHLSPVQHSSPSSTDSSSNDSIETPRNHASPPTLNVQKHDFHSSHLDINQTVIETPRMQVNNRLSRRISVNPEDDETEKIDSLVNVTKPLVRRVPVNLEDEITEYPENKTETAGDETTHQDNLTTKPVSTDSPDYESFDDESTMGNSQSTTISSRALKRKAIENTRPRRKARPDPSVYKEPSLRTKLRRSRNK